MARIKRTTPRIIELPEEAPSAKRVLADPLGLPFVRPVQPVQPHRSAFLPRRRGDRAMQGLVVALVLSAVMATAFVYVLKVVLR